MKRKGFTLIELLVVITLIGILMGIALVSYQATRKTARDGKRKADLEQIRSALEMYRADCGSYPVTGYFSFGGSLTGPPGTPCAGNTYMSLVPNDPLSPTYSYSYARESNNKYLLCAYLEGGLQTTGCSTTSSCGAGCGSQPCNYRVCQP